MQVTFLGSGTSSGVPVIGCNCSVCRSPDPRDQRYRASVVLRWNDFSVIIDTGPEFRLQILRAGIHRLDAILLTHEHADHICGLDDIRFFTMRGGVMPMYGNARSLEYVRSAFSYIFDGTHTPGTVRPTIETRDISGPFELRGATVIPIPVMHGKLPILGYRIGDFAYITDCSAIPPESMDLLRGLDTLVLGALRERPHPTHFSIGQALESISALRPRRAFLTHIGHEVDHESTNARLPTDCRLAYDGLTIEVGEG
jgi:phosphoribosyl 1,2-cyclic phosphate phosphodiesterase